MERVLDERLGVHHHAFHSVDDKHDTITRPAGKTNTRDRSGKEKKTSVESDQSDLLDGYGSDRSLTDHLNEVSEMDETDEMNEMNGMNDINDMPRTGLRYRFRCDPQSTQ